MLEEAIKIAPEHHQAYYQFITLGMAHQSVNKYETIKNMNEIDKFHFGAQQSIAYSLTERWGGNKNEAFDYVNSINNHRLQTIQQLESDQLLEKKLELNAEFVSNLDEHLNNNLNIVNLTYIHSAYKLLEYFNKTKLILSGFDTKFDFAETSIDVILVKIRDNDMSNNNESTNSVCQSQNLTKKIIQKILLDDKNIDTKMNTLNQSLKGKGARATLIRDIFNLLEHEGIDFL